MSVSVHINHTVRVIRNPTTLSIKIPVSKIEYQIWCQYWQVCCPYLMQYTEKYQLLQGFQSQHPDRTMRE
jgi:hypothetical protein